MVDLLCLVAVIGVLEIRNAKYEGRSITKLQNSAILLVFQI